MSKKRKYSVDESVTSDSWALIGSYAGSPFDWFIVPVVYADPQDSEVVARCTGMAGTDSYLQVFERGVIRAVAKPTAVEAAAEGSAMGAAVKSLAEFKSRATALWGRGDETIANAERALEAAREAKWALLDSLFAEPVSDSPLKVEA